MFPLWIFRIELFGYKTFENYISEKIGVLSGYWTTMLKYFFRLKSGQNSATKFTKTNEKLIPCIVILDTFITFAGINSLFSWTKTSSSTDNWSAYLKKTILVKGLHLMILLFVFKTTVKELCTIENICSIARNNADVFLLNIDLHWTKLIFRVSSCINKMVFCQDESFICSCK